MICRLSDLREKDVIHIRDGMRLGSIGDVELDTATARVTAVILYGRLRWFGLLGREEDRIIRWNEIEVIGADTVLVSNQTEVAPKRRSGFWRRLRGG